jgi:hypothetical protein
MILDDLLKPRDGGSSPAVTATEPGATSLTPDATTGKVVVQVDKMPAEGLPIVVVNAADTGTSTDKTAVVTIEASDTLDSGYAVVATFPTYSHGCAAGKSVRRVSTQKKYIRSVITVAGSNGTISIDFGIFVGIGMGEEG